ncbi:hypothetical protein Tco_1483573, partial [Tanacetum coccineum]
PGDGVTSYTRRRHNPSSDGITSFHDDVRVGVNGSVDKSFDLVLYNLALIPICNTSKSGSQQNVEYPRALLHSSIAQDLRTTTKRVV